MSLVIPASDTFLRSLFGSEPQPDVFITWGVAPVEFINGDTILLKAGVVLHNAGENIGKNINGYAQIGGKNMAVEVNRNTQECFSYSTNSLAGMKVGFVAKNDFKLGIEQEVLPVTLHIKIKKPTSKYGVQIKALVSCDNQMSYRISREVSKEDLEKIYDAYVADSSFDVADAIFGVCKKGED